MRVLVDARPAVFPQKTGVGYYTWHLLRLLPQVDPTTTYVAWYLNAGALIGGPRRPLAGLAGPNLVHRGIPIPARWFERLSHRFELPRVEWFTRSDVVFAPNFVPPPTRNRRLVVTIHDLAFRRFPRTAPHGTPRWLARLDRTLAVATRVIAVSQATRRDLLDLYGVEPAKVRVIPLGVDGAAFRPLEEEVVREARRRFGIHRPYVLYLGGIEPRKNLPNLVRAVAALGKRVALVIAGAGVQWNPQGAALLQAALAALPLGDRLEVIQTGYVSEGDKAALLSGAEALVYPSLYEGFGLPLLEAMACGTPVVTSDRSSLPEVAGDAAVLADPDQPEAITAAIDRVLSDGDLRKRLREAGIERAARFDWTQTARKTAEVLREASVSAEG